METMSNLSTGACSELTAYQLQAYAYIPYSYKTMVEAWHCWHCAWSHWFFDVCDIVWLDGCITWLSAPNIEERSSENFFNSPTELCLGITTMDGYETIRRETHSDFALPMLNSSVQCSYQTQKFDFFKYQFVNNYATWTLLWRHWCLWSARWGPLLSLWPSHSRASVPLLYRILHSFMVWPVAGRHFLPLP